MAIETPLHLQRRVLIHQRHLTDGPMAGVAAHAFIDVNAVIEKNEVRELVDARPLQRLPAAITGAHRLEHGCVRPDLRMAVHAGLGRWNTRETRLFDRGMTVP